MTTNNCKQALPLVIISIGNGSIMAHITTTAIAVLFTIGFLQIRILVIFSLTSGYQPILTKFSANVAYFLKLNLTILSKITNELISNICSEVIKILLDTCK